MKIINLLKTIKKSRKRKICCRCGRCCTFQLPNEEITRKCKYLIGEIGKKTACRIYRNRKIGLEIYKGVFCLNRDNPHANKHIDGCTYL
jgi:uncharacterized cysteine cluster protein YcgN (CxxCxxCC family)